MTNPPAQPCKQFVAKDVYRTFAAGVAVGLVVWLLAQSRPGNTNSFVSSIVLVAAASASIVCYTLGASGSASVKARSHEVPAWLCAIGVGIVLSLHAMNFLMLAP